MKDSAVAVSVFSNPLWKCYTVFDGLAGMRVEDLCQDQRGFIWVATADGGVSRFDGVHFDNLTCAEGLPYPSVSCIAQTEDGRMWFGTFGGGLAAWDGRSFQVYTVAQGLPSNRIRRLYAGPGNTLQVVTWDGVCTLAEGCCSEMLLPPEGLSHDGVFDVATDAADRRFGGVGGVAVRQEVLAAPPCVDRC